jgi:ABC-2 type transport system ATP-binding protein
MIQVEGVSSHRGTQRPALEDLTFSVPTGTIYALLGATGAGKTTLVNMLRGIVRPESGRASIGAWDCSHQLLDVRRHTVFVTPDAALFATRTVRSNVDFFCRIAGAHRAATPEAIENACRRVALPERDFDRPVRELDREAHVRVWLAVACLRNVSAVVLDDPTADVDATRTNWIREALQECRDSGQAILVATSDVALATGCSDVIGILRGGRLQAERARGEMSGRALTDLYVEYLGAESVRPGYGPP